jgi:small subunit ribosomal protein S2
MALPEFTMRQLLEAGVHFGHQTQRWNPRMGPFIFGARNGIHIMDLTQTVPMLDQALQAIRDTVAKGGRVLFVGTKRQAATPIAEAAEKCAQYYMNHRWLGGTLTNWQTVSKSIQRLKQIDEAMEGGVDGLTKKERLGMERDQGKLQSSLGGIREMGGTPDLIFVIDVKKEQLAIAEANKLGIPVVAVVDSNCPPDGVDYIIPGNDDAARAIALYCDLAARAALDGMSAQLGAAGVDLGAMEETVEEAIAAEAAPVAEEAPAVTEAPVVEKAPAKAKAKAEAPAAEVAPAKTEAPAAEAAPAKVEAPAADAAPAEAAAEETPAAS